MDGLAERRCRRLPGEGDTRSPGRPQARLLERDVHLRALWAHVAGGFDGPVVIEGRSGSGRTAALRSLCRAAELAGWTVLRTTSGCLLPAPDVTPRRLLGERSGRQDPDAIGGRDGLAVVARGAATGQPLDDRTLVAVDDADRTDEETTAWLGRLARSAHRGVTLAMTIGRRRPGSPMRPVDRVLGDRATLVVPIGPLTPASVEVLGAQYFGTPVGGRFARSCHHESGGYPALLFALFHEVALEGAVPGDEAAGLVGHLTSAATARSVARRLGDLDPAAAAVLHAVAVAGTAAAPDAVAEVAGVARHRLDALVDQMAALDLLDPGTPLVVSPPLLRRTVYAEIATASRSALHRRWAQSLQRRGLRLQLVADHLLATEPAGEALVADGLRDLGEQALRSGDAPRAAACVRRAIAEGAAGADRPTLLADLARAESSFDLPAALDHLDQATRSGTAPGAAADAALAVARMGHGVAGRQRLSAVLRQVADASPPGHPATVDVLTAGVLVSPGESLPAAAEGLRRALDGRQDPGTTGRRAAALVAALDVAAARPTGPGGPDATLRWALLGEATVDADPLHGELWARAVLALACTGAFDEAERHARHQQGAARATGLTRAEAEFAATAAASLAMRGRPVDAERHARRALESGHGQPWARRAEVVATLVGALVDQGRLDDARMAASSVDADGDEGSGLGAHRLLEERGRIAAAEGRHGDALRDLLQAGRRAGISGIGNPAMAGWRQHAALALAADGRPHQAVELAAENLAIAESVGTPWVVGTALHVVALVGPPAERPGGLQRAVDALEGTGVELPLAAALIDLGRALHRHGAPASRVRPVLRRGADLAVRCGGAPLAATAAAELRGAGARPRRLALSGIDALTAAEQRVVAMAASGLTNAEIAARLVLAQKTIEGHLFRAYRKLQVRSRRELRAVVAGGTVPGAPAG